MPDLISCLCQVGWATARHAGSEPGHHPPGAGSWPVLLAEPVTPSVLLPLDLSVTGLEAPCPPFPFSLSWTMGGMGLGMCMCVCGIQAMAQTSLCPPPPHTLHDVLFTGLDRGLVLAVTEPLHWLSKCGLRQA